MGGDYSDLLTLTGPHFSLSVCIVMWVEDFTTVDICLSKHGLPGFCF